MSVRCADWSDAGVLSGGYCHRGLYGGTPSAGVCAACPSRREGEPRPPVKLSTSRGPSFDLPGDDASVEAARLTTQRGGCCGAPKA